MPNKGTKAKHRNRFPYALQGLFFFGQFAQPRLTGRAAQIKLIGQLFFRRTTGAFRKE